MGKKEQVPALRSLCRGSLWLKERKKTDNPREGWEDGTPPPHRFFVVDIVISAENFFFLLWNFQLEERENPTGGPRPTLPTHHAGRPKQKKNTPETRWDSGTCAHVSPPSTILGCGEGSSMA